MTNELTYAEVTVSDVYTYNGLCYGLGSYSLSSHGGVLGSVPGQCVWDLWWTGWQWDRFLPDYFGLLCLHPTNVPYLSIHLSQVL